MPSTNTIDLEAREPIVYKNSYVAFLDILGFKELVFSKESEAKEKIERYLGIVDSTINYLKNIPEKQMSGLEYIVISDSIILSVPCSESQEKSQEENLEKLRHLCVAIAQLQYHLAIKDIWLRGAICYGETYINESKHQIIGKAYIEAYNLESLATYPRVILDKKIIKQLKYTNAQELVKAINTHTFDNWDKDILFDWSNYIYKPHANLLMNRNNFTNYTYQYFTKDIPLFIHYLDFQKHYKSIKLKEYTENITDNIIKNTKKYKSDEKIYPKHKWIDEYFSLKDNKDIFIS
jgi:hypothetical protein